MSNKNKNQHVNEEIRDELTADQTQSEPVPDSEATPAPAKVNVGQKILGGIRTAGRWVWQNKNKILTVSALAGGAVLGILNKDKIADVCCPGLEYTGDADAELDSGNSVETDSSSEG